jgi:putative copper resistance protein D
MSSARRLPRLALSAWLVAVALLVALGIAVARYLGESSSGMGSMPGMSHGGHSSTVDALSRAGADPLGPLLGSSLFTAWQLNAIALAVLVLLAAWYLTGVALVPVRAPGTRWPLRSTAWFLGGLAVCAFATNGSIAVYDQALFSAHMLGHLALVMLAPAMLIAGRPLTLALAAASPQRRERLERVFRGRVVGLITAPPVALACYAVVIVGSHLTGAMDVIMRNTWAGQLEHLVYLVVGLQFFVLVVGAEPIRWQLSSPVRWLLLAVGMAVDTFTGIVLMQGTMAVAMVHTSGVSVNALSDTRTGGAIMWFGGDAIMAVVMVALVLDWLKGIDTGRADEKGFLEQARRAAFVEHTGASSAAADADAFDEDDVARESYNEWLRKLDSQR